MDISTLRNLLKQHWPAEPLFQEFAVLIPIFQQDDGPHILFEVRSEKLQSQPGEICLPGGRMEPGELPEHTALRETCEELGICLDRVELLGAAVPVHTPFRYALYPYIGWLNPFSITADVHLNPDEVAEVFSVPLAWFLNTKPQIYPVTTRFEFPEDFPYHLIQNGRDYAWKTGEHPVHFYRYGNRVIWGMTARIIYEFCNRLTAKT